MLFMLFLYYYIIFYIQLFMFGRKNTDTKISVVQKTTIDRINQYRINGARGVACPGCGEYLQSDGTVYHTVHCIVPSNCLMCGLHGLDDRTQIAKHQPSCIFAQQPRISPLARDLSTIIKNYQQFQIPSNTKLRTLIQKHMPMVIAELVRTYCPMDEQCPECGIKMDDLVQPMICIKSGNLSNTMCGGCTDRLIQNIHSGRTARDDQRWIINLANDMYQSMVDN